MAEAPAAALVALGDRAVLAVTGAPRLKFLHAILSNDVQALKPGQGCRAALMDVKGRLLAFVRVLVEPDAVRLEVAGGRRDAVEQALAHYRVATPVRFEQQTDVVQVIRRPWSRSRTRSRGSPVRQCGS